MEMDLMAKVEATLGIIQHLAKELMDNQLE